MIANGSCCVAELAVRFLNDIGTFSQVGFERALEHVAGINQHHGALIGGPCSPQVGNVTCENWQAFECTMQIVGADERQRKRADRSVRRLARRSLSRTRTTTNSNRSCGGPCQRYAWRCYTGTWSRSGHRRRVCINPSVTVFTGACHTVFRRWRRSNQAHVTRPPSRRRGHRRGERQARPDQSALRSEVWC